jgi:hypothetical protein
VMDFFAGPSLHEGSVQAPIPAGRSAAWTVTEKAADTQITSRQPMILFRTFSIVCSP